jgi:hypothetical protein
LLFRPDGKLLLLRVETLDQKHWTDDETKPKDHPRVCRLRELLDSGKYRRIAEIDKFRHHVFSIRPCGVNFFVVEGRMAPADGRKRMITVFDAATGDEKWSMNCADDTALDPSGTILKLPIVETPRRGILVEVATGKVIGDPIRGVLPWPMAGYGVMPREQTQRGFDLYRQGDETPLLHFGIDTPLSIWRFNRSGTQLIWAESDGVISVCDLAEVNRRLTEVGLGW